MQLVKLWIVLICKFLRFNEVIENIKNGVVNIRTPLKQNKGNDSDIYPTLAGGHRSVERA